MAGNTIGQLFRVTTFGESHGLALGCTVALGHRVTPPSAANRTR